jgi:heme oxygenase
MMTTIPTQIDEDCFNVRDGTTTRVRERRDRSAPPSIRTLLRQATATLHEQLDARVMRMLAGGEPGYAAFLRGSAAAVFPLENALEAARVASILPDWELRSRRNALSLDLADLGETVEPIPPFTATDTDAFSFGILYVLEGSRLGAALLASRMPKYPSERAGMATRYLKHGAGQGLWPSFLEHLEAAQSVRSAPHEAVSGAQSAFAAFAAAYSAAAA